MIVSAALSRSLRIVQNLLNLSRRRINWDLILDSLIRPGIMQMTILCVCACVLAALATAAPAPGPQMSDAQLEQTLASRATMQRHLKCALGEGACDPVGRRLRTLAPLVLRGACPQCSAQETRQIRRTLAFVQRNYPWEWAKIVRQYG